MKSCQNRAAGHSDHPAWRHTQRAFGRTYPSACRTSHFQRGSTSRAPSATSACPSPRPHATRHPQILFTLFPRSPPDLLTPVPAQNPGLLRVPTRSARTPHGGSTRCTSRPRKVRASTRARTRSIRGTASFDSGTRHRRSPGTRTRLCATRPRTRPWRATSPPSRWRTRTGGT